MPNPYQPTYEPAPEQTRAKPAQPSNLARNAVGGAGSGTQPGHPLAAQLAGVPPQNGMVQPNGQPGQAGYGTRPGRGTGFGVPLGVQIRDALKAFFQ